MVFQQAIGVGVNFLSLKLIRIYASTSNTEFWGVLGAVAALGVYLLKRRITKHIQGVHVHHHMSQRKIKTNKFAPVQVNHIRRII